VKLLELDVTDGESVTAAVSAVLAETGRIDALINNAGIGLLGAAEESSDEQVRKVFDVNVFGPIRLTREVLPHMRGRGSGRIVHVSSVLGTIPQPYMALYAATKHAIEGYSTSLDHEVREFGIRSILVEPAYTKTSFDTNLLVADVPATAYASRRVTARALIDQTQRTADEPDVVARVIVAAASAPKPALRYPAGPTAKRVSVLRRLVPPALFDRQIHVMNRLGAPAAPPAAVIR
jgi:NAD(P)-dependent dehydrogenase (short-subunit alcohol dehydrogenase family)